MLITITHYQFHISEPYTPGHVLSASEAEALNRIRTENVRNNAARALERLQGRRKKQGATSELLSEQELAAFRDQVTQLDQGYRFELAKPGRPRTRPEGLRPNTIEAEARAVAQERLDSQLKSQALEIDSATYDELLRKFLSDPTTQSIARERLAAKISSRREALEDLLGGD